MKGIISEVSAKPWKDTFIWNIEIDNKKYSLFAKEFNFQVGDELDFEFAEKNGYLNITSFNDSRKLSYKPTEQDISSLKAIFTMDDKMIKATLMKCAVDLCIKRGTLSDEEIWAQYERFIKALNLELV